MLMAEKPHQLYKYQQIWHTLLYFCIGYSTTICTLCIRIGQFDFCEKNHLYGSHNRKKLPELNTWISSNRKNSTENYTVVKDNTGWLFRTTISFYLGFELAVIYLFINVEVTYRKVLASYTLFFFFICQLLSTTHSPSARQSFKYLLIWVTFS